MNPWATVRIFTVLLLCAGAGAARADAAGAYSVAALLASYRALGNQLSDNQFRRPIHLNSSETPDSVTGDIYALVNHHFASVGTVLNNPGNWCDVLILHINTKYCRASAAASGSILNVSIGKKSYQPLDEAYGMTFGYHVVTHTPTYLQVRLNAKEGPLSTRNYHIVLEAMLLESGQTFIRLSYSYAYGLAGRLAMQTYLGTIGSQKVGFTVVGKGANGQPLHVGGMRGLVERNTMRYYLAIEAFLGALSVPPQARLEKSLRDWFATIESYPRQLHELKQGEYLDMKRREYRRQQTGIWVIDSSL